MDKKSTRTNVKINEDEFWGKKGVSYLWLGRSGEQSLVMSGWSGLRGGVTGRKRGRTGGHVITYAQATSSPRWFCLIGQAV